MDIGEVDIPCSKSFCYNVLINLSWVFESIMQSRKIIKIRKFSTLDYDFVLWWDELLIAFSQMLLERILVADVGYV